MAHCKDECNRPCTSGDKKKSFQSQKMDSASVEARSIRWRVRGAEGCGTATRTLRQSMIVSPDPGLRRDPTAAEDFRFALSPCYVL
jgi:hypothetical protein